MCMEPMIRVDSELEQESKLLSELEQDADYDNNPLSS